MIERGKEEVEEEGGRVGMLRKEEEKEIRRELRRKRKEEYGVMFYLFFPSTAAFSIVSLSSSLFLSIFQQIVDCKKKKYEVLTAAANVTLHNFNYIIITSHSVIH